MADPFEEAMGGTTATNPPPVGGTTDEYAPQPPPNGEWFRIDKKEGFIIFSQWTGYEYKYVAAKAEGEQSTIFTAKNGQPYLLDPKTATATPFTGMPGVTPTAPEPILAGGKYWVWDSKTGRFLPALGLPEVPVAPQKRNVQIIQHGKNWYEYDLDTKTTTQIDMGTLDKQRRTDIVNTGQGWQLVDLDTGEIVVNYPLVEKEKADKLTAWQQRSLDLQIRQLDAEQARGAKQDELARMQFAASLSGPSQWAKYMALVQGQIPKPPDWMAKYTGRAPEYETSQEQGWHEAQQGPVPWGTTVGGQVAGPTQITSVTPTREGAVRQWFAGEPTTTMKSPGLPEQTPQAGTWAGFTPTQQQELLGWQEYQGESMEDYYRRMSKKWPGYGTPTQTRTAIPRW